MYTSTLRIENNNRTSDYSELLNRAKIHVSLRIDGRGSLSLRYTKPWMILHFTYQTCLKKKNYIKTFDHLKLLRNQSLIHRNMAMYSIIPFFGCLCESTLSGLMFLFYNLTIKFFFFLILSRTRHQWFGLEPASRGASQFITTGLPTANLYRDQTHYFGGVPAQGKGRGHSTLSISLQEFNRRIFKYSGLIKYNLQD